MLLQNKEVAIIGGGPGGLTLARLLQLKGARVQVYERDINPAARVQGATLDLHYESGLKAIQAAGLMDAFKAHYRPGADKGRVVDEHANIIYDEHQNEGHDDLDSVYARPEIDRGTLRDLLLAALEPGTVVWDSQLVSMSTTGEGRTLAFKNGTTVHADIVIGADGANSKIRPFVTPVENQYSGIIILQGNIEHAASAVPETDQLLQGGKIYAFAGGKYLHVSSKGDGSLDLYISCKKEETWVQDSGIDFLDREQVLAWFKMDFPEWGSIWLQLFEQVSLPLLLRPQYCMPLDLTWDAKPDITLLGDAAHLMPPSGEGVNLAMLDALELSDCLTGSHFENIQAAFAAYEKHMLPRAVAEAGVSLDMVGWMHGEDALTTMVQLLHQNQ